MKNMGNMSQYEIITKHNMTRCKLYTCCEFQPYMVFHGNRHATIIIPPLQLRWKGGILVSPCLSVHPSVCPSVDRMVSALYLQQYLSDPFHISISYQATTEGVLHVLFLTKLIYSNENYWILISDFTETCSTGSNWQYVSIGADNGMVPYGWKAIIWNNDGLVYWHTSASVARHQWVEMYILTATRQLLM